MLAKTETGSITGCNLKEKAGLILLMKDKGCFLKSTSKTQTPSEDPREKYF